MPFNRRLRLGTKAAHAFWILNLCRDGVRDWQNKGLGVRSGRRDLTKGTFGLFAAFHLTLPTATLKARSDKRQL
jgi:hypothetical protein